MRDLIFENPVWLNDYSSFIPCSIPQGDSNDSRRFWFITRGTSNCQMNIIGEANQLLSYIYKEDISAEEKQARKKQVLERFRYNVDLNRNILFDVEVGWFDDIKDLFGEGRIIFYKKYTNTTYSTKMIIVYVNLR